MKKLILPLFILVSFFGYSQSPDITCENDYFYFNNLRIPVNKYMGWYDLPPNNCVIDGSMDFGSRYDNASVISESGFCLTSANARVISGIYDNNLYDIDSSNIVVAGNELSLRMGPISDFTVQNEPLWQKYWHITKWEIDYHLANYSDPNYIMPNNILTWPAHGDTTIGESYNLAPFQDVNSNGIYDPENGDYPLIKGDNCIYMIMNDIDSDYGLVYHKFLEVHKMIYAFNCPGDSALMNSVFFDYNIYNKGPNTLYDVAMGNYVNFDIGDKWDDYVGSDVMRGAIYGYNSTETDSEFGSNIPVGSYMILKGLKREDNGIDDGITYHTEGSWNGLGFDDGIIDNEYYGMTSAVYSTYYELSYDLPGGAFDPPNLYTIAYYLNGMHPYGSNPEIYFGGNGRNCLGSCLDTKFTLPGVSDPLHYATGPAHDLYYSPSYIWDEDSLDHYASNRMMTGATSGSGMAAGHFAEFTTVYTYSRDFNNPGVSNNRVLMGQYLDNLKSYFIANQTPCGETFDYYMAHQFLGLEEKSQDDLISIYPNPTNSSIQISGIEDEVNLRIYDTRGQLLKTIENFSNGTVDLSLFENGIYLIQLELDGQVIVKKIVKH